MKLPEKKVDRSSLIRRSRIHRPKVCMSSSRAQEPPDLRIQFTNWVDITLPAPLFNHERCSIETRGEDIEH